MVFGIVISLFFLVYMYIMIGTMVFYLKIVPKIVLELRKNNYIELASDFEEIIARTGRIPLRIKFSKNTYVQLLRKFEKLKNIPKHTTLTKYQLFMLVHKIIFYIHTSIFLCLGILVAIFLILWNVIPIIL